MNIYCLNKKKLDIMERGTKQCEKLMEWMTPKIERKILISDAKVPFSLINNKNLRAQPYVQNRVHNICKLFKATEAKLKP